MGGSGSRHGRRKGSVEYRDRAKLDIIECADYLAENADIDIAGRFIDAARTTLLELASMPMLGSPRSISNDRLRGLRQWSVRGFSDYLVFYLPIERGIEVVRVFHGARDRDVILRDE